MIDLEALNQMSYGLYVLATRQGERSGGCIINTAMQVTVEPNRIIVAVNKQNATHAWMAESGVFALSVLDTSARFETIRRFGYQSSRDIEKFSEMRQGRTADGVPYLAQETCAWLAGRIVEGMDLGTHTLFLADVTACGRLSNLPPATYAYYQQNIKPKPQTNPGAKGWICKVCGYVYEGESLPPDFICPLCKHGAADFEPLPA